MDMNISNEIRKLLIDNDITLTQLAQKIATAKGKHYTIQNLSQKLKNKTINITELEIILETLNYQMLFYPKNK